MAIYRHDGSLSSDIVHWVSIATSIGAIARPYRSHEGLTSTGGPILPRLHQVLYSVKTISVGLSLGSSKWRKEGTAAGISHWICYTVNPHRPR